MSVVAVDTSADLRAELSYQDTVLPDVSRTFALTIPQLPESLRVVVTNAYLLCRIADALEDDAGVPREHKRRLHAALIGVLQGERSAEAFAREAHCALTDSTDSAERELVANTARVIAVTDALSSTQRSALVRCVARMCEGMPQFQTGDTSEGLATREELERYCYYVAGIVGEMLTDLFCEYSEEIARHREEMMALAPSFGKGLQITNILKDVWEDRERGFCWLPRDVFDSVGYDLRRLSPERDRDAFNAGIRVLVGIAHGHLRNALRYTLRVPPKETGIRKFCLWSVGLAVLTLRRILAEPRYTTGAEVKVSRRTVAATILATRLTARQDTMVEALFAMAARGLPLEAQSVPSR